MTPSPVGPPTEILSSTSLPISAPDTASGAGDTDDSQSITSREDEEEEVGQDGELVQEEWMDHGSVKLAVYKVYYNAVGRCLAPMVLVALFLMQGTAW